MSFFFLPPSFLSISGIMLAMHMAQSLLPWSHWSTLLMSSWLATPLYTFALVNNVYQVITHGLSLGKFFNLVPEWLAPGGARDQQKLSTFIFHNQVDIWGWYAYALVQGGLSWPIGVMATGHIATEMYAAYDTLNFQKYYIQNSEARGLWWWIRVGFVGSDALLRVYMVYALLTPS